MNGRRQKRATTLEGLYANYFEVGHAKCEFVIVFGQYFGPEGEPVPHTHVVTGPVQAKELASLLVKSLGEYEHEHGPIGGPNLL